jgi:hypothetical protein
MATSISIKATFVVHEQADGTLVATAIGLPMVAVAKNERDLRARMKKVADSLNRYILSLDLAAARAFLDEQHAEYVITDTSNEDRKAPKFTVDMLVGAS